MNLAIFCVSLCLPILWFRSLFALAPDYFKKPLMRTLLGLRWHHLHWGILFTLAGTLKLLLVGESSLVFVLLGLGLGNMIDLFLPSLFLETDRRQELNVYRKSLPGTILFAAAILALLIGCTAAVMQ